MKELERKLFTSLVTDRWGYYILNDGYFVKQLPACNDERAKEMFYEYLNKGNQK